MGSGIMSLSKIAFLLIPPIQTCLRQHEEDMEHTFAIARSKDKTCGICMEVVLDKSKGEAR